jgi:two-component system, OmpR family, response regulator AdeR
MTDKTPDQLAHGDGPNKVDFSAETVTHIKRILVVEDNVELGQMLQMTLRRMQYIPFVETLGQKAITVCQELNPELVLLDINLPDMNGWKVLDAIMEARGPSGRPAVVVITAYADPANRLMGKLQGINGYLVKPFLPEEVARVITDVLGAQPK